MKIYAAILAGGKGLRLGSDVPKQFLMLRDKPIIQWSVETFASCAEIDGIVIVCPSDEMQRMNTLFAEKTRFKILAIVPGGETRQGSSLQALNALPYEDDDIILIHDAARPFVTMQIITDSIAKAKKDGAAGVYLSATDTITEIQEGLITSVPKRDNLYYAQTPQTFKIGVIKKSHQFAEEQNLQVTDDVSLVLAMGHSVKAVKGDPLNIKITDSFDYEKAKWITTLSRH